MCKISAFNTLIAFGSFKFMATFAMSIERNKYG